MAVSVNNSVAFRMAYLLGMHKDYLESRYTEEYVKSNKLKYFENYYDAGVLRSLCRVRQSVLADYVNYTKKIKKSLNFPTNVKDDVEYLKKNGINLEKGLKELETFEFFNYLTEMIEAIQYKVIFDLEIPHTEILEKYFYFPKVNDVELVKLSTISKEYASIHSIYVYESEYIKQTLKYVFNSDKNIVISMYSIMNKSCDVDIEYINYTYRTTKGEDPDKTMVIDAYKVLEGIIAKRSNREIIVTPVLEPTTESVVDAVITEVKEPEETVSVITDVEVIHIDTEDSIHYKPSNVSIYDFMAVKPLEIYVDCDNVEFFKFITFMNSIKNTNTISGVTLIVDEKANYLWKVFDKFYTGKVNIKTIFVPRLKDHKSVADIVLTKEVCQSVYSKNQNRVVLVSSDSDFFGLISVLPEVSFGVAYVEKAIAQDYLNFLYSKDIPTIDLMTLDTTEFVKKFTDKAFTYYMLNVLSYLPMYAWTVTKISEHIYEAITSETDNVLDITKVKSFVSLNFDNVSMEIKDETVILKLNDIVVEL